MNSALSLHGFTGRTNVPVYPTRSSLVALVCAAAFSALPTASAVDATWNYAVQLSANVQASPAQIVLQWTPDSSVSASGHMVYRWNTSQNAWELLASLSGSATGFADSAVTAGTSYEYKVVRNTANYQAFGYLQSAIELPAVEQRGKVILVVDNSHAVALATELTRLQQDLIGDGWTVIRHDVSRQDTPQAIKDLIVADYNADPANVKSVFLFGRVPVPYSGVLAPDGHSDHMGAWPADVFYGDVDGRWTDFGANFVQTATSALSARLTNIPGDGKFDQSTLPSAVELQVGRVDLSNLPGRSGGVATFANETELLRQYLNKDHAFRHRTLRVQRRAVIGEYFGNMGGEAFAASGYRGFAPIVGPAAITNLNAQYGYASGVWIPTLASTDALVSFGSGPGTYTSVGSIGTTTEMVQANVRSVFTLLCGSYFGDWDSEDNVLRSVLATRDVGLAAAWSGRPHWVLHSLGLGDTLGSAALATQNNKFRKYENQVNNGAGLVHVALLGDPTLRLLPVAPATALSGLLQNGSVTLAWSPSADAVLGYHVYRAASVGGTYSRLTTAPVSTTTFVDASPVAGASYLVRALRLETTASGSFYSLSQGQFWTAPSVVEPASSTPATSTIISAQVAAATTTVWIDDSLPAGSVVTGTEVWSWSNNPTAASGSLAYQSAANAGLSESTITFASAPTTVLVGDVLFLSVYLDPVATPQEIMVSWKAGNWEHRAYWGANRINQGKSGTESRRHLGKLPAAGQWVTLVVPVKEVGLGDQVVTGISFATFGGRATFDRAGVRASQ